MWRAIDKEMTLRDCSIYSYAPDDDPYDDEDEPTLWGLHYFFFSKPRKRVCYIYLRGTSMLNRESVSVPRTPLSTRTTADDSDWSGGFGGESGASKRAKYWLGDRFEGRIRDVAAGAADEDEDALMFEADEDQDQEPRLLPPTSASRRSTFSTSDMGSVGSSISMDSDATASMRGDSRARDSDDEIDKKE